MWPSRKDLKQSAGAIGRGSVLGFFLGILPGGGATISSLAAYAVEKKRAKNPERFGKGAVEGVAGTGDRQQRRRHQSSFIPLLTLGIPANATMAIIFGALLIQGVTPGPQLVDRQPGPVLGRRQLDVHRQHPAADHVHPAGRLLRAHPADPRGHPGADYRPDYHARRLHHPQLVFDVLLVVLFGAVGYLMKKFGFEPGPLVLAFVLGALLESSLRRSLLVLDGDVAGFMGRPISATLLVVFVVVAVWPMVKIRHGPPEECPDRFPRLEN